LTDLFFIFLHQSLAPLHEAPRCQIRVRVRARVRVRVRVRARVRVRVRHLGVLSIRFLPPPDPPAGVV